MNGLVKYSFDNFMDYFELMIKNWKPEDFDKPVVNLLEMNFFNNTAPLLSLLQKNDFVGALKFLQGKNIFNQINNDCVNNKINVLFNVQNNTSIIDNSRNNINIINNFIQNRKIEEIKPIENPEPVEVTKKLRNKIIKIKNRNEEKILKIDKKIILSESSLDESSEGSVMKEFNEESEVMLNRKKGRYDMNDEGLLNKYNSSDDMKNQKRSKYDESSESDYKDDIKNLQILQPNHNRRQARLEDHEIALIKTIDNPKKKRTKAEILEKNQLKIDLHIYETQYEADLNNTLEDTKHGFMKQHFPIMYNLENYFLYIKNLCEKRCSKKHEIIAKIDKNDNENDKISKVWDPRKLDSAIGSF